MLELHGWDDLTRSGEWVAMPNLITDEILDTWAVTGSWAELPGKVLA